MSKFKSVFKINTYKIYTTHKYSYNTHNTHTHARQCLNRCGNMIITHTYTQIKRTHIHVRTHSHTHTHKTIALTTAAGVGVGAFVRCGGGVSNELVVEDLTACAPAVMPNYRNIERKKKN